MAQRSNQLARTVAKFQNLPDPLRKAAVSRLFGFVVKFFGTASIRVDEISDKRAVMTLKNRRKVQNHIGTVHAAAMSLLAESCTGMLLAMSVPDDKLPLMKTMSFNYVKRAAPGELVAVAELSDGQLERIQRDDKGEVTIDITITDTKGVEPVLCQMTWAWIPKKRA
ncbi:MAG: hotdog fold domain-containing protein [Pseudomonadota bacterium]